jgi:hypothetical protein
MKLAFDHPDERRVLAGGLVTIDLVRVFGVPVMRVSHAPRWRWSEHSAAEAGAPRCPNTHLGVMVSGVLHVELADSSSYDARPGDAVAILPGHDAWTVGDEPAVLVQFGDGGAAPPGEP